MMPSSNTFIALTAIAASLISAVSLVNALPGGAPRCIINENTITNGITKKGHGAMNPALGFTITAAQNTYTPGQMMAINVNGLTNFNTGGILAYVSQDSNPLNHVGQFALTGALRAQTASVCQGQNVVNDAASSTITHMNPLPNTNIATLMWTAPATDVGPVTVNAVVATGTVGKPWMILPVMQLQPAGAAAGGAVAPAAPAMTSAAAQNQQTSNANAQTSANNKSKTFSNNNNSATSSNKNAASTNSQNSNSNSNAASTNSNDLSTATGGSVAPTSVPMAMTSNSAVMAPPSSAIGMANAGAATSAVGGPAAAVSQTLTIFVAQGVQVVVSTLGASASPAASPASPAPAASPATSAMMTSTAQMSPPMQTMTAAQTSASPAATSAANKNKKNNQNTATAAANNPLEKIIQAIKNL